MPGGQHSLKHFTDVLHLFPRVIEPPRLRVHGIQHPVPLVQHDRLQVLPVIGVRVLERLSGDDRVAAHGLLKQPVQVRLHDLHVVLVIVFGHHRPTGPRCVQYDVGVGVKVRPMVLGLERGHQRVEHRQHVHGHAPVVPVLDPAARLQPEPQQCLEHVTANHAHAVVTLPQLRHLCPEEVIDVAHHAPLRVVRLVQTLGRREPHLPSDRPAVAPDRRMWRHRNRVVSLM